jgi:hypothetical protein
MIRSALVSSLLGLLVACPVMAESKTFEVTVAAGEQDRVNVPVSVLLTLPASLSKAESVTLADAMGNKLPAQLTAPALLTKTDDKAAKELNFILPSLKANATTVLKATVSTDSPAKVEGFNWQDTPGEYSELKFGTRPVLKYMCLTFDDSTKEKRDMSFKVFHHLYDPTGEKLVTKGPPGGLFPHHRGIFYGFNQIVYGDNKKADIWHCTGDTHMTHEKYLLTEGGPVLGRQRVELAWHGVGKEVFAKEERELTVWNVPGGQFIEFASRVRTTDGKIKLNGDPQHAGFHFRAAQEIATKETYYLRPDGPGKPGETRNWDAKNTSHKNLPWDAMSFVLGKERYTVGYFDKPTNPKEARFSERDYGRFGSYFEYEVTDKTPLEVDYRLWLQKGEMKGEEMTALSNNFVKPVVVTVK